MLKIHSFMAIKDGNIIKINLRRNFTGEARRTIRKYNDESQLDTRVKSVMSSYSNNNKSCF